MLTSTILKALSPTNSEKKSDSSSSQSSSSQSSSSPDDIHATSAVPQLYIWTGLSIENLQRSLETASDQKIKDYLSILIAYKKKLTANNVVYNNPEDCELVAQAKQLAESLTWEQDAELKAAAYNLEALSAQKIVKDYAYARRVYQSVLDSKEASHLKETSLLSLRSNKISSYYDQKQIYEAYQQTVTLLSQPLLPAEESIPANSASKKILASTYQLAGVINAKVNDPRSYDYFAKAREYWPTNDVLINNMGIPLSKMNALPKLREAKAIFEINLSSARAGNLFVAQYYHADVCEKLASFYAAESEQYQKYTKEAAKSLAGASAAAELNPSYSEEYRNKARSRCAVLRGRLASLELGDRVEERIYGAIADAAHYRNLVPNETAAKKAQVAKKLTKLRFLDFSGRPNGERFFSREREPVNASSTSSAASAVELGNCGTKMGQK